MYPLLHEVNCELHLRTSDMSFAQQTPSKIKNIPKVSFNHYTLKLLKL